MTGRYEVAVLHVPARPTVVVRETTTWAEFPAVWQTMSQEVWACVRAGGIDRGCRNVMRYVDDRPTVEVGVELDRSVPLTGRVVASTLPAGRVAMTVHRGSYAGLGAAHDAVHEWCASAGLTLTRERWEVYGPHHEDEAQVWTEIYWLLAS